MATIPFHSSQSGNAMWRVGGAVSQFRFLWLGIATLFLCVTALSAFGATADETRLYRVAKAAYGDGLYGVSAAKWQELFEKYPASQYGDEGKLLWGESLARLDRAQEAFAVLDARIEAGGIPEKWAAGYIFWSAEALLKSQEPARAADRYRQLLKDWPTTPHRASAYYGLAIATFQLGELAETQKALDAMREAVRRTNPPPSEAGREAWDEMQRHSQLMQARIWLADGRAAEAQKMLEDIVEQNPHRAIRFEALRWLGESHWRQNAHEDAMRVFGRLLESKDSVPREILADVWMRVGDIQRAAQKPLEAAESYSEAFKIAGPTTRRTALIKRAESLAAGEKRTDAVAELRTFVEKNPTDSLADAALLMAADLLFEEKLFAEALKTAHSLIAQYPQSPLLAAAHHRAGWCLLNLKREAESITAFSASAQGTDARIAAESQLKLADAHFLLKRYAEAAAAYEEFLKRFPQSAQRDMAQYQLGVCWSLLNQPDVAAQAFSVVAEAASDSALAARGAFERARSFMAAQDYSQARAAYEQFLAKFSNDATLAADARLGIAQSYQNEGRYDDAIQTLRTFLTDFAEHPRAPRAAYELAWSHFQKGDVMAAQSKFEELLSKFPSSPLAVEAAAWLANRAFQQKDYAKAQEQFVALAEKFPQSEWADTALYMAGRSAALREDWVGAFQVLERLLKNYPESRLQNDALFLQANCRVSLMQFDNAIALFDIIIAKVPDSPLGLSALGRKGDCQFQLQRFSDAAATYRRLLDLGKADADWAAEARYKLGRSLEKQGNAAEALAQYADVVYGWLIDSGEKGARNDIWFCRAAFDGARIAESRRQPREAIRLLERVVQAGGSACKEAEQEIRRLKVTHFDFR